jgi:hypothetical protein
VTPIKRLFFKVVLHRQAADHAIELGDPGLTDGVGMNLAFKRWFPHSDGISNPRIAADTR